MLLIMKSAHEICGITDFDQYIDYLSANQDHLLICAVARDTLFNMDAKSIEKLQSLGMTECNVPDWIGYVYLNDEGVIRVNSKSDIQRPIFKRIDLNSLKIELISCPFQCGNDGKIIINNINWIANGRGLNIVVYDKQNNAVVDSVCFDFFPDSEHFFTRHNREKHIKRILPLIHIVKEWASVEEKHMHDSTRFVEKFDEEYEIVSIVDSEGEFKGIINKWQLGDVLLKRDYGICTDLYVEYDEDEKILKRKLAELFLNMPRQEVPILRNGKVVALGRYSAYFDLEGRWDPRQVYNIHWNHIDKHVAREYFAPRRKVLISSECGRLKGFKEAFSSWLDIEVYSDDLLDKCLNREYDLLIYVSDGIRALSIESRYVYQLYFVLMAETYRRWLQENDVVLHYFSIEGRVLNDGSEFSTENELPGGTISYLRDGQEPYFIIDKNAYDNIFDKKKRQPNFHAGRRCVADSDCLSGNNIYFFGPCTSMGYTTYCPDKTIESFIQKKINSLNLKYHVVNCSNEGVFYSIANYTNWLYRAMDTPVRGGDQVIVLLNPSAFFGRDIHIFPINIHKLSEPFIIGKCIGRRYFIEDFFPHMNVLGYEIAADYIFQQVKRYLEPDMHKKERRKNKSFFSMHKSLLKEDSKIGKWLERLPQFISSSIDVGAIIFQADPLTNSHIYLIKEALKMCEHLCIFIIDREKTLLQMEKRRDIIEKIMVDYPVSIMSPGKCIRECYKMNMILNTCVSIPAEEFDPVYDTYTFSRYVAPRLGIKKYFLCSDIYDVFEQRYNIIRKEILSEEGILCVDIKQNVGNENVASITKHVRELWKNDGWRACQDYLPEQVCRILEEEEIKNE